MKDSVQSAFYNKQCEKKDNTLQETENDSVDSACCITFSIQQQHTRKRKRSTEPTPDQPDSAKLYMCCLPCIFIFHRQGCAVSEKFIDFLWGMLLKIEAKSYHGKGDQKIHDEHKQPESHKKTSYSSIV